MQVNPMIVFRREFDNTGVLFNPDNGETFGLNPVSVVIWEQLEKGAGKAEILTVLADRVNALPESAAADLDAFLRQLQEKGLLSE